MSDSKSEITLILERIGHGEEHDEGRLFDLVYDELKSMAQAKMLRERSFDSLHATALVNEAYLRLAPARDGGWENRRHFFGAAAEAMRRILIDRARARQSEKRGGDRQRVELHDHFASFSDDADLLDVDAALAKLSSVDARKADVVKHRFFLGLSIPETARCLGVSPRTVDNEWKVARAWFRRELAKD